MTNTFKNDTLENKIEVLKEINAETAGWGINELLMENCDYYSSWHMNHMDMHNLSFEHHADETIKKKCKGSFINMVIVLCEDENGYKFTWYFGTTPSDK